MDEGCVGANGRVWALFHLVLLLHDFWEGGEGRGEMLKEGSDRPSMWKRRREERERARGVLALLQFVPIHPQLLPRGNGREDKATFCVVGLCGMACWPLPPHGSNRFLPCFPSGGIRRRWDPAFHRSLIAFGKKKAAAIACKNKRGRRGGERVITDFHGPS